jgi:hypothetical protein
MASRIGSLTDFAPLAPPWQLTQLDQNTTNIAAAFNDASLGYVNAIATDTGSANNYAVTCGFGTPSAYNAGFTVAFVPANTNTGASTITVSPLGSLSIVDVNGNALQAGAIQSGRLCALICMGSTFRIVNLLQSGGVPYSYDYDDLTGNPKFMAYAASGSGATAGAYTSQIVGHPGIGALVSGTAAGTFARLSSGIQNFLDTFTWTIRSTIAPGTIGTSGQVVFGFDSSPGSTLTVRNGIFIFGAQGTTNWQCRCSTGATDTQIDSGVAFNTLTWHDMKIVASTASVAFYIDGVLITTITTNIPASNVALAYCDYAATGSAQTTMFVDDFEFLITGIPQLGTSERFLLGCI